MNQIFWLDVRDPARLLDALLRAFAGRAEVAVETTAERAAALDLRSLPGARPGPAAPFSREHGPGSAMTIVPLAEETAPALLARLAPGGTLHPAVGAVQLADADGVQLLAGDSFHRDCVSVGPGVEEELLRSLVGEGVLGGYERGTG